MSKGSAVVAVRHERIHQISELLEDLCFVLFCFEEMISKSNRFQEDQEEKRSKERMDD